MQSAVARRDDASYRAAQEAARLLGGPDGRRAHVIARAMALLSKHPSPVAATPNGPRRPNGFYAATRIRAVPSTAAERRQASMGPYTIRVRGDITPFQSARTFRREINTAAAFQPVIVDIETNGGNVHEARQIATDILAHPGHTKAFIRNFAHSAGVMLVAAADERVATRRAQFLLHLTAIDHDNARRLTAAVLRSVVTDDLLRDDDNYAAFVAARIGATARRISELMNGSRQLTAVEAQRLGLLTEVIR